MFGSGANKYGAKKSGTYDSKVERLVEDKFKELVRLGLVSCFRRCTMGRNSGFVIIPELSHIESYDKVYKTKKMGIEKVKHIEKKVIDDRAAHYRPDFFYYDCESDEYVMLEVKSFYTKKLKDYVIRRKLIKRIINAHNLRGRSRWRFEEIEV